MHPLRQSALRIVFLCTICIIGSSIPAKSADSPSNRCFFSFHAEADADFVFLFAAKDSKNHYKLNFDPKQSRLTLLKVIHGVEQPLISASTPQQFAKVGIWLLPRDIRIELDNRLVLVSGDQQFRSARHSLQIAGAMIGPVSVVSEFPQYRESFDDHKTVGVLWEKLAGNWDFEAPLDESAQQNGGPPMHSYWRSAAEGTNLAAVEKTYTDSRESLLLKCNTANSAGIAFNVVDKDDYAALVLVPGEQGTGKVQLLSVENGEVHQRAEGVRLDVHGDQWYKLIVETHADRIWCSIIGLNGGQKELLFGGVSVDAASGAAGTIADGPGAVFEDMTATPIDMCTDEFDIAKRWKTDGLKLEDGCLAGTGSARLSQWMASPNRIDVDVHCPIGSAAIFTHSPNASSYYAFGLFDGELQFQRVLNKQVTVLARTQIADAAECHLALIEDTGLFRCVANGREVFSITDTILPEFGGGLIGENARFENFRILRQPPQETILFETQFEKLAAFDKILGTNSFILPAIFKPSGPQWHFDRKGDKTALLTDNAGEAVYHYQFDGPVSMLAETSVIGGAGIGLTGKDGSYAFCFSGDASGIELRKNGNLLGKRQLPQNTGEAASIELIRRGKTICGFIDGKPMLKFDDPVPLKAVSPGIIAEKPSEFFRLKVATEGADFFSFASPAPAWRPIAGEWIMHGGRKDPGVDHWISAIADDQPAWLWDLQNRPGDLELHVTVMPFAKGYADGGSRQFDLEDVQFAFCSFFMQQSSGYNVVLRPEGRDAVAVFRGEAKVAEQPWQFDGKPIRLSISKTAGEIVVQIDGEQIVQYVDDKPLTRGYLALGVGRSRANFLDLLVIPRR